MKRKQTLPHAVTAVTALTSGFYLVNLALLGYEWTRIEEH